MFLQAVSPSGSKLNHENRYSVVLIKLKNKEQAGENVRNKQKIFHQKFMCNSDFTAIINNAATHTLSKLRVVKKNLCLVVITFLESKKNQSNYLKIELFSSIFYMILISEFKSKPKLLILVYGALHIHTPLPSAFKKPI